MRRGPYSSRRERSPQEGVMREEAKGSEEWLSTEETAVFLKKFRKDGSPSVGAIRNMVYRRQLEARKFFGRLFFYRPYLERAVHRCQTVGGSNGN